MAWAYLTLLVGALVLLIFYLASKYTYWKRQGIPTVKGLLPLVGHAWPIIAMKLNYTTFLSNVYKEKSSSMVGFYKLTSPVLMVRDPSLVKTVMQSNFSSFHENASQLVKEVDPLLALHPFFTSGEEWNIGRKSMSYAFSGLRLRSHVTTVNGVCKKLEDYLNRRLKSNAKYELELKALFSKFTGEVVANAGFGIEGHCFEEEPHPLAFDKIGNDIFLPGRFPMFLLNIAFNFSQFNKILKFRFLSKNMDKIFRKIAKENVERKQKEATPSSDFIQLMIGVEKMEGGKLNLDVLTAHAVSFYFEGYETSSLTLTFIGYHLAVYQDIQQKLREEVLSTLEKHGGELTYEALKEMTYMDQVISESQRHYPALGFYGKKCTEKCELQGSDGLTLRVEPGTEIVIPAQSLHMDPEYWPDPEVFDPERFSPDRKRNIEKMTFIPFGEGPRICIGMRMAMVLMKAALTCVLRSYKLELSPKTQVPLKISPHQLLTMAEGGVWVHVSKL